MQIGDMRLYQNVRKRYSVDSGIRESAFLVLQIHAMSRHTSKEGSPRLLHSIVNVQVRPGAPLEHIYYVTCPETTCLRHRFLVCWLPILFFFFLVKNATFRLFHIGCWALQRQDKASGIRKAIVLL